MINTVPQGKTLFLFDTSHLESGEYFVETLHYSEKPEAYLQFKQVA